MSDEIKHRKFRWGLWLLVILSLVAAGVLIVPPLLTQRQERQIQLRIARYQAAGEPASANDLRTTPLVDEENAVIELRKAGAMISAYSASSDAWKNYDPVDRRYPLTATERPLVRKIVADNATVLSLVDAAMKKPGFYWPSQPTLPLISWLLPDLAPQRALSLFLTTAALADADVGYQAAVAQDLSRALFVMRALEHHPPALIVSMVVGAMRANICDTIIELAPHLQIGGGAAEMNPAQVRQIIAELLDDKSETDNFYRGFLTERVLTLDTADAVITGRIPLSTFGGVNNSPAAGLLFSPIGRYMGGSYILADVVLILDADTTGAEAIRMSDWPAAKVRVAHLYDSIADAPVRHFWARIMMPNLDHAVENVYRGRVHRRLAATALAVRWFACDHGGQLPPTLDALVPKYLPTVPSDAYAAGAPPLHYLPAEPDPRIYSVGSNGIDDHGVDTLPTGAKKNGFWDRPDAVIHLKTQPRDVSRLPNSLKD